MRGKLQSHYDVIVIGSGMGGLTAALLHAKFGKQKVLLVDQHFKPGGFTHAFSRGKYSWNVGLHYLGAMSPGTFPRKVMDLLTRGQVGWRPLPDPFEVFHFPTFRVEQPRGRQRFVDELKERYPDEPGIDAFFQDLRCARNWGYFFFASKVLPTHLAWLPRVLARLLYGSHGEKRLIDSLNEHFSSDAIKAVLAGQCGDYGLSAAEASLFIHATVFYHYEQGAHRPESGAQALVDAMVSHLVDLGGDVAVGHRADEILIKSRHVNGVRLTPVHGEDTCEPGFVIGARRVVSAVGARNTYLNLIAPRSTPSKFRESLRCFPPGVSLVVVYLGLKEDPGCLGFKGENHWFYQATHLERLRQMRAEPDACGVPVVYASFDQVRNARGAPIHTATLIAPARYQTFLECGEKGTWKHRSPAYEKLKAEQGQRLIDLVEKKVPGFRLLVDTMEISTPLSLEYFSRHPLGEVYGLPAIPERYQIHTLGPRTPIKGLTLAGADSVSHGIVGAMVGGLTAYTSSLGPFGVIGFFRKLLETPPTR